MKNSLSQRAARFYQNRRRKQLWYRAVSAMACVVVFCTVYALILPAITLEKVPTCGLEEHVHTEECYTWKTVYPSTEYLCGESLEGAAVIHTHDAQCYDRNGDLVCPLPELEAHVHDEDCYRETEVLSCGLEETGHIHDQTCYTSIRGELACELEEEEGHSHGSECYETSEDLVCYLEEGGEHTHDDSCYESEEFLVCDLEEREGHTHSDDCYDWSEELTCGQEEDLEGHIHDSSCYTTEQELACGEEEVIPHTHGDSCYDESGQLICELPEVLAHQHDENCVSELEGEPEQILVLTCGKEEHTHTDECFIPESVPGAGAPASGVDGTENYICGLEEHTHDEACYDEAGELICGLEEHIHDESCVAPQAPAQRELTYIGTDYTVSVSFGEDAALPEDVTLSAEEIVPDSEEYQTYYQQTLDTLTAQQTEGAEQVLFARFFDIQFQLGDEVLEPAAPVSVTITYHEPVETGDEVSCQAIHFTEEGTTSFTHTQESFSVAGTVVTRHTANAADVGPDSLPVDYYVCIDGKWTRVGATRTGWYNNWNGTEGWTDYNRDYITVAQAVSILGEYGFTGAEENPSRITAYQQKTGNLNIYSDTNTVEIDGQQVLPLSRNDSHAGYNLYYLPVNTAQINGIASPESLDKAANGFYTVTVCGNSGEVLWSELVPAGGDFTYNASDSGVTNWLVAYDNGTTQTIEDSSVITLDNITSAVRVSPKRGDAGSHSVTFKVMLDGQWQEVGSLPYYYSGKVNGSQRAYITSDMAAQFFGKFGYTADTAPGYQFGYSYNDIYKIYYADNTGYCMDINGNKIENSTAVQLWTSNNSTAQIFRIWDSGEGYSYITPVENSAYHVNVLGGGTTDGTKLGIHTATDAASHWKVVQNGDGTVSFYNKNAPSSAALNLPSGTISTGNQLEIRNNGSYRYWKLIQQYRISNNTVSEQTDGTWKIGLTAESNGDIVCYYMPGETGPVYTDAAESALSASNTFWSVRVVDDSQGVYTVAQQEAMTQYVQSGTDTEVTVRVLNADGVLWACRGVNGQPVDVTSVQDGGYTTFTIKNITHPIEVTATRANPGFTVQYYANIPRFATSGNDSLKIIDTSGGVLPTNGGSMATRNLYLEAIGRNTGQNNGVATPLYRVATTTELSKMYADSTFHYEESPGLSYFNKLKDNESYALKEIWVLKSGKDPASMNQNDWTVYTYSEDTAFTNEASQAVGNTILISDGAVIRLVSDTSTGNYYNGTTFYDYNIASGKNTAGSWDTNEDGINSAGNYSGSGAKFAFGNQNCGVILKDQAFDGNTLNKANSKNASYNKATFELVTGLDGNGNLIYNSQIQVPKLFNEGDATGKQTYAGSSLTFDRVGDTYTLSAATLKNSNGQTNTIDELQYFFHPSPAPGKIWDGVNSGLSWQSNIFTNNFWPMDQAAGRTDGLWGTYGNPGMYYDTADNKAKTFPTGDDGRAHNWFFGMNFALNFTLTADYVGPLEYTFFGDDDLWVFLDGQLICDIGGVHSSIGEFVNLRDYLPVGSTGTHTLSFFYTERGASGSTCYMSFTLPSVSSATTGRDIGQLQIGKTLGGDAAGLGGVDYEFRVELLTHENGTPLNQTFSYKRNDDTYGTVRSGDVIKLKSNETVLISGLPAGTYYTVTELTTAGYKTTVNGDTGFIASGKVENDGTAPAKFVNTPCYELPQTGGTGTSLYTLGGLCLMAGALLLLYRNKTRGKGGRQHPC